MDPIHPAQCTNCQAVTTNDGKTVWVCENCGEENQVGTPQAQVAATPVPDASVAQAAVTEAAAQAAVSVPTPAAPAAPVAPAPEAPVAPVAPVAPAAPSTPTTQ